MLLNDEACNNVRKTDKELETDFINKSSTVITAASYGWRLTLAKYCYLIYFILFFVTMETNKYMKSYNFISVKKWNKIYKTYNYVV